MSLMIYSFMLHFIKHLVDFKDTVCNVTWNMYFVYTLPVSLYARSQMLMVTSLCLCLCMCACVSVSVSMWVRVCVCTCIIVYVHVCTLCGYVLMIVWMRMNTYCKGIQLFHKNYTSQYNYAEEFDIYDSWKFFSSIYKFERLAPPISYTQLYKNNIHEFFVHTGKLCSG